MPENEPFSLLYILECRELQRHRLLEIAGGRVWSGAQAKELGLVDEIGGVERALALIAAKTETPDLEARHDEAMRVYQQQVAKSAVLCCLAIWEKVVQQEGDEIAKLQRLVVGIH